MYNKYIIFRTLPQSPMPCLSPSGLGRETIAGILLLCFEFTRDVKDILAPCKYYYLNQTPLCGISDVQETH